jgi:hypothetical protein
MAKKRIDHQTREFNNSPHLDQTARLPGWPGNRTRDSRSGLDPLENEYELAHMEGILIRNLFTGNLRPLNKLQEYLILGLAVVFLAPPAVILGLALLANQGYECAACSSVFLLPVGVALVYNYQKHVINR